MLKKEKENLAKNSFEKVIEIAALIILKADDTRHMLISTCSAFQQSEGSV